MPIWSTAAAAAAKSLQSCPTLCNPIDGSPPGSSVPGILQTRILEWVAISFSSAWKWKVKVKSLSRVRLLATHGLQPTRLLRPWDFPGRFLNPSKTSTSEEYAQQINEIYWKLQLLQPVLVNRKGLILLHNYSWWHVTITKASKVEWIGLQSFVSSIIFTWPQANWLPLLQASQQCFAGKTLPQPAGGRKRFSRVGQIPKHGFLCYRNK